MFKDIKIKGLKVLLITGQIEALTSSTKENNGLSKTFWTKGLQSLHLLLKLGSAKVVSAVH